MKILVTGGAGFIGSHIVDAYIDSGHQVAVLDDLSSGRQENLNPKAQFFEIDIQDQQLAGIFEEHRFDLVNHHAAQMDVRRSVAEPQFDARVNVLGTLNILENCVKFGTRKFIFASTGGAVYGEQDYFPADEEHPTWPISPYGITKLACEKYLYYYQQVHQLTSVILRYANVYGPRQNPHGEAGVVAIFTERFLKGEQPVINGDGKQTRDYIYVGDLVRLNVHALDCNTSDVFNAGTGIESDVNTLYRKIRSAVGSNAKEFHGPAKAGEQLRSCLSAAKALSTLGWKPEVDLEKGIAMTVDYFQSKQAKP